LKKKFEIFFFKNSEIQAVVAVQKFPDSIGNGQGNSPETGLPCPQISSNDMRKLGLHLDQ